MFTGIIEAMGVISTISGNGTNKTFQIISSLAPELKVDQSLSHDGVCLTVESVTEHTYQVTAIAETLAKSILPEWRPGTRVNLERCLQFNGRLDGHLVQGHVDSPAKCIHRENLDGSWVFRFEFPESFRNLIIEKGSIAVNGISLTCFDVTNNAFSVAIIPYTYDNTNIRDLFPQSLVNLEFDLIGKYVERMVNHENPIIKQI
ncbi:MAG TPA: riboflavin synthase [Candidatus Paceibacterota bacterium]|nr:riboflavin synthase [Candidatus Paceibacterota bacterium]